MNRYLSAVFAVLAVAGVACASPSTSDGSAAAASASASETEGAQDHALLLGELAMRQVLSRKLLGADSNKGYVRLKALLEGQDALKGTGIVGVKMGSVICERALGKDECDIEIFDLDDKSTPEEEESVWKLRVNIFQGTVTSAKFGLTAG